MLYEFFTEATGAERDRRRCRSGTAPRGSAAKVEPVKSSPASQNTLTPADLAPAWRGPQPRKDAKHAA